MKKINVGIIGAGLAGGAHAAAYSKIDNVRLLGVVDPDEKKGKAFADRWGAEYFAGLKGLLDSEISAVSICTPHNIHDVGVVSAAEAGKHILLEKPIAVTVEKAERAVQTCRENNVKLMIGMTHHFYPEILEARRLMNEGAIGQVYMAQDRMVFPPQGFLPWVFQPEICGGGVWMENGIHGINRLRWFLGSEVAEVTAHVGAFVVQADGEDNGMAILRFQNGTFATMVQVVSPGGNITCDLELHGSEGTIKVETWKGMTLTTGGKTYTRRFRPQMINLWEGITEGIEAEVRDFVRCIEEDTEPAVTGQDGLEDLRVIMAVYESSAKGRKVLLKR